MPFGKGRGCGDIESWTRGSTFQRAGGPGGEVVFTGPTTRVPRPQQRSRDRDGPVVRVLSAPRPTTPRGAWGVVGCNGGACGAGRTGGLEAATRQPAPRQGRRLSGPRPWPGATAERRGQAPYGGSAGEGSPKRRH